MTTNEALKVDDDGELNITSNDATSMVPTWKSDKLRRNSTWMVDKSKIKIFSAYELKPKPMIGNKKFDTKSRKDMRQTIKAPKSDKSKQIVHDLIDKSIDDFKDLIDPESVELIIPLASKSSLNNEITDKLLDVCVWAMPFKDALKKRAWKEVDLDANYDHEADKSKERARAELEKRSAKNPDDDFQVHSISGMGFRRYFNFLKTNPEFKEEQYKKMIEGKTILFVDDTLEEGATMRNAVKEIAKFKPKEILVYIFLYTTK